MLSLVCVTEKNKTYRCGNLVIINPLRFEGIYGRIVLFLIYAPVTVVITLPRVMLIVTTATMIERAFLGREMLFAMCEVPFCFLLMFLLFDSTYT